MSLVPAPPQSLVASNALSTQVLQLYEKLIDSLSVASNRSGEQQQNLQQENKQLFDRCQLWEIEKENERKLFPPEFHVLKRELTTYCQLPTEAQKDFPLTGFFDALVKLVDWVERDSTSVYKLSTFIELYSFDRGYKPNSLAGKIFGPEMARFRDQIVKDNDCPSLLSPMNNSTPQKATKKRKHSNKDEVISMDGLYACVFSIEVVALSSYEVSIMVKKMDHIKEIYLFKPKEKNGVLVPLSKGQITLHVKDYCEQNFKKGAKDSGLIFLVIPSEPNELPLVCVGKFEKKYLVSSQEIAATTSGSSVSEVKKNIPADVIFRFESEIYQSRMVRKDVDRAAISSWINYLRYIPYHANIAEKPTRLCDKSDWKAKVIGAVDHCIQSQQ